MRKTKEFVKLVEHYLNTVNDTSEFDSVNVIKENHFGYEYVADTVFGSKLLIRIDKDRGFYTVFTRFEEPDKVKDLPNINKYSGKWNFHVTMEDPDHAADYVIGELAGLIEFNEREKELFNKKEGI